MYGKTYPLPSCLSARRHRLTPPTHPHPYPCSHACVICVSSATRPESARGPARAHRHRSPLPMWIGAYSGPSSGRRPLERSTACVLMGAVQAQLMRKLHDVSESGISPGGTFRKLSTTRNPQSPLRSTRCIVILLVQSGPRSYVETCVPCTESPCRSQCQMSKPNGLVAAQRRFALA